MSVSEKSVARRPNMYDRCECGEWKKKNSARCRSCYGGSQLGSSNPNWRGGRRLNPALRGRQRDPGQYDRCSCGEWKTKVSKNCARCAGLLKRGEPGNFRLTYEWLAVRRKVLKRDRQRWQRCRSRRKLHVHHIIPAAVGRFIYALWNLVTLCESCHRWVHSAANVDQEFLR